MKVIGNAGKDLLVQMSADELARISGVPFAHEHKGATEGNYSYDKSFPRGFEVKVNALFDAATVVRRRPEQLEHLAQQLRDAADKLDSANKAIASPFVINEEG